jgi:Ca2+/H+ antiporter, TMEM165/GDT1 family
VRHLRRLPLRWRVTATFTLAAAVVLAVLGVFLHVRLVHQLDNTIAGALEGLEIVFIVITFGLNANSLPLAVTGAVIGGVIVLGAGLALHKPLARVRENTIKFAVGLLLSTFGSFWAIEGLGLFAADDASLEWPGGDAALPVLLLLWCGLAWGTVRLLRPRAPDRVAA